MDGSVSLPLSREALYALVWETPLSKLAPKLGYSDVGLAKACGKMKVPRPNRGYWAKKAAGKRVRRPPLPALPASDYETPRELAQRKETGHTDGSSSEPALPGPVADQVQFESDPRNRLKVAKSLRSPHELVETARDVLRGSAKGSDDYVRNWRVRHLDIDVSKASLTRALRIMNTVVKAFEKRGWEVSVGTGKERGSYVRVLDQKISFGIREPWKQVENEPAKPRRLPGGEWYTPHQAKYREEPSGRLALVVRNSWGRAVDKSLGDTKTRQLEDRLNDFMVLVVKVAHQRAEWHRQRIESEMRRREEEQIRLEERRKREAEAARFKALTEQANRWRQSRTITDYIEAARVRAASVTLEKAEAQELTEWLDWAEERAQALDPLSGDLEALYKPPGPLSVKVAPLK